LPTRKELARTGLLVVLTTAALVLVGFEVLFRWEGAASRTAAAEVKSERRTVVVQTSIYRSDGKLAAMITQTQLVLPREPSAPAG
jgi:hypothetical protein